MEIVPAPVNEEIYGNPGCDGMMYTAGSNAVTGYYQPLRMIGAQVRRAFWACLIRVHQQAFLGLCGGCSPIPEKGHLAERETAGTVSTNPR
jgi:hypothetical protein